ncbi:peptidase inhibitor family I36 [Kribbella amoyensis]|uniref:Peptidase inhibitor family I36 n=1 Tax=Kribbella amoyensis TaxID=996641 RepID=A0A561BSS6_9ACTN|nr:peptidase inhibitor family I36 protein [Kribbella amoyensis]TWD81911.1 peptidase inhibitor family I36 [Kribbella amoyensis]
MFRKRVAAAVMISGLAVATFGAINPASASESAPAAGSVRMWEDPNYTGSQYVDATPANCPDGCDIDGWDGDNEISSVRNETTCTVRLYADDNFGGRSVDLAAGESYSNLELVGFDNDAESFQFVC